VKPLGNPRCRWNNVAFFNPIDTDLLHQFPASICSNRSSNSISDTRFMLRKRIAWEILCLGTRCHVLVHLSLSELSMCRILGMPRAMSCGASPPSPRQVAAQRLCNEWRQLGGAGGSTAGGASTAAGQRIKRYPVVRRDSKYHQRWKLLGWPHYSDWPPVSANMCEIL
jgi:hypothetical protein